MASVCNEVNDLIEFKYVNDNPMLEEIKTLFKEYAASIGVDLSFQGFELELQTLPGKYSPPEGALILAIVNGIAAGCVALRRISDNICEMKRLFVRQEYRKLGIGKKLVSMIIEEGKRLGYSCMRLDTLASMKSAVALYQAFGFYDIEPYIYNPLEGARYMELKLKEQKI